MKFKNQKYRKLVIPALGIGIALGIVGSVIPSVVAVSSSVEQSVSVPDNKWNISDDLGKPIGKVRHWQNNGFSGAKTRDGGFVALTETNSVSRTDSFGNILWTFNPSDEKIIGHNSSWKDKKAVEIVQDQGAGYENVFYVLLVPQATPETNDQTQADGAQTISYQSIVDDESKQATIVQIVENIAGYTSTSERQTSFAINKWVHINPKTMVDNYPKSWRIESDSSDNPVRTTQDDGIDFFSLTQHASWYDDQTGSSGFVMPWRQYITNLGNMYGFQGRLFMFGGNGTIFNDPEALSIGLYRINFEMKKTEVTGLPYAFVFSGISWFLTEQPSVEGETGIYHSQSRPIVYESRVPMGQDPGFSYVPRMAVAGIQPNFDLLDGQAPSYLYIAGTITTGQSKDSQKVTKPIKAPTDLENGLPAETRETSPVNTSPTGSEVVITTKFKEVNAINHKNDGWNAVYDQTSTRSMQQSGENYIPVEPLSASATSENSIDPLTLFGTPLSMSALMTFQSNTATDPHSYTDLMFNGRYYDASIFLGYQGLQPGEKPNNDTKRQPISAAFSGGSNPGWNQVNMLRELVWSMRLLTIPTLSYGYSTKSVGGLTQFTDTNGNRGYSFQVGVGTISFVEPQFDAKSIVYRNPSLTMMNYELIGDAYVGSPVSSNNQPYANNYYWFNNNNNSVVSLDTISHPQNAAIFDNWKVEDYTATWKYSILSKQVAKGEKNTEAQALSDSNKIKNKRDSKLDFSQFRGLSTSLGKNGSYNSNIGSLWSSDVNSEIRNFNTKQDASSVILVNDNPLLSIFGEEITRNSARAGRAHHNINIFISGRRYTNDSPTGTSNFDVLIYQPTSGADSTSKNDIKNRFEQQSDSNVAVVFPSRPELPQSSFMGQLFGNKNLVSMRYDGDSIEFEAKNATERKSTLGLGTFNRSLSNELLQKSISDLLDFNVNVPGVGTNQIVLNKKWLPQFFNIIQQPKLDKVANSDSIDVVQLVITNMDLVTQSMTVTAYAYNQDTRTYAFMPSSNEANDFASISVAKFTGFKALASWVLPVAITVPIIVLSLVMGLGFGIGLPMQKNKQMLKLGFEIQNKKVYKFTTAVGGVFKKIVNQTKPNNLSKSPQMLKASNSKPTNLKTANISLGSYVPPKKPKVDSKPNK